MADEIVKKYKVHRVSGTNSDGSAILETVHPETEAGQVLYAGTIGTTDVANVDQALGALATLAQNSGVTGVKGAAESTYRKGDVNLTPANIGLGNVDNTSDTDKPVSTAQQTAINNAISSANSYTDGALESYIPASQKGAANGVATLGDDGRVLSGQLPSYVDDVLERYVVSGSDPFSSGWLSEKSGGSATTPETGKIYVVLSSGEYINKTYRWSGTSYVEISASLVIGTEAGNAFDGLRGLQAEQDIAKIKNGDITVGKAADAADAEALGGIPADQYVTFDKMPEEFVIVTGSYGSSTLTLEANAYTTIQNAVNAKKLVVLDVTGIGICYYNHGASGTNYGTYYFRNVDGETAYSISVTSSNASVTTKSLLNDVISTGTGAFVSKVEQFGNAVSVTRKAITNDDLPTPVFNTSHALYSAVRVNPKGIITAGGNSIEWGTAGQTEPSNLLMTNGLFFELVE